MSNAYRILSTLALSLISLPSSANLANHLLEQYGVEDGGSCRVMKKTSSERWCVAKVIDKDFTLKGDYHYFIILGRGEDCHLCSGLVDIYALNHAKKQLIALRDIALGSWGEAPNEWDFTQRKSGKVTISTTDSFVQNGNLAASHYQFYIKGNQLKQIVKQGE